MTRASLTKIFEAAQAGSLEQLTFMDLDHDLVERQLARERSTHKHGPVPEAVMRDAASRQ